MKNAQLVRAGRWVCLGLLQFFAHEHGQPGLQVTVVVVVFVKIAKSILSRFVERCFS
jgi:hypothetical protein